MDPTKEKHQILCKSRKKCDGDPGNDKTIVRGRKREQYRGEWMACSAQGRPQRAIQVKGKIKSMLIIFSDIKGIVQKKFAPAGQIVNSA
jgi:hypothetical protein